MAQGILGNIIEDKFVSIPIEDYDEYKMLLKGRQVIVDTLERDKNISVLSLLSCLGGAKASRMYAELVKSVLDKESDQIE